MKFWKNNFTIILECGLHSGFPLCCILFFYFFHSRYNDEDRKKYNKFVKNQIKNLEKNIGSLHPSPGYIACPLCAKTWSFVSVYNCDIDHCARWEELRLDDPARYYQAKNAEENYRNYWKSQGCEG